jgi:gas vesicle structural protein
MEVSDVSSSMVARQPVGSVSRRPASGTLAEVIDIILDKGLVLDAYVRISVIGIELLTIEARVVIASVDTYLHFAEATNRLDLVGQAEERDMSLGDLIGGEAMRQGASAKTEGALEGAKKEAGDTASSAKERIKAVFSAGDDEQDEAEDDS